MLTRRRALAILGTAGIGTSVFQRALAAKAAEGPVSPQMVADAEWVAGIKLTPAQREAAASHLNTHRESMKRIRAIELDNAQRPGLGFTPLTSPASRPDPRGYQVVAAPPSPYPLPRRRGRGQGEGAPARPNSDEDLAFTSIRHLGTLLRSRKISSVELTRLYLARLRRYDPLLKCVVTFMDEVALEQAKRADRELVEGKDRGALHGIPWGLKDIIAYPGYPTTWCAPQYRHRVISIKAAVAERLENAGAVLIAKLATNPFAGGGVEWYRGLTRSPWNPHLDAAGSSSGSGSAIAAGLVGFSIATDTAGSIIHPSMRCGTVGLRPTYGRVSRHGCMQLCWSLDTVGPICRSADDCGLVLAAIHGADPRDAVSVDRPYVWPSSRDISTIRVGYSPENRKEEDREKLRVLRELGVKLVPIRKTKLLDDYGLTGELIVAAVAMESAASFDELTRRGEPKGVHGWPRWWAYGHLLSAVDYLKISRLRAILMEQLEKLMQTIDIYFGDELGLYTNLAGHPVLVFPRKFEKENGFLVPRHQFMAGRAYDESTLLALADAYQRAIGLKERPPLEKFLADKDQFLKDEKLPDENKLYID
jgi:Asp-tRNA(Asn)/Glu-tRNA(Gln) amidotransferase A subunit family amidase